MIAYAYRRFLTILHAVAMTLVEAVFQLNVENKQIVLNEFHRKVSLIQLITRLRHSDFYATSR